MILQLKLLDFTTLNDPLKWTAIKKITSPEINKTMHLCLGHRLAGSLLLLPYMITFLLGMLTTSIWNSSIHSGRSSIGSPFWNPFTDGPSPTRIGMQKRILNTLKTTERTTIRTVSSVSTQLISFKMLIMTILLWNNRIKSSSSNHNSMNHGIW